ncbi:DUF975 family protein [Anabaenopsis tanganyikae CS-531]|uniref:DUF975 family protein n=2 Tax=Anabaenopsis TaxID=110103 RepID=A0ABT5ATW0_9CYAN|nr:MULTISPECIES: DUF975 family protein [Anabaenopsis]MDB9540747.1 DUF975 family protein [Anabaenopsis arnoldii]MDH6093186.1 DUF975 family protein [Anabaenopsis arnoldii]MDH6100800.1 DUF975 family protein [Anabaenopsis sp. FSS-46]MDH6107124.1 DUF975 family protein [Anabaenopsis tanganyikae CS-531]
MALISLISRLAFGELVNQPESIPSGQRFVNSRLWEFLVAVLLLFLVGVGLGLGIVIIFGILGVFWGLIFPDENSAAVLLLGLITLATLIVVILACLWIIIRLYLVDAVLAIEENVDGVSAISRSWQLTQGYGWRLLLIYFVGSLIITIPAQIMLQVMTSFLQLVFSPFILDEYGLYALLYFVFLLLAIIFSISAMILPFYQTLTSVIYYDLRSRREGLGLKLRDHEI